MEPLDRIRRELERLDKSLSRRERRIVDRVDGPRLHVGGKVRLSFASNDYLGLSTAPEITAAIAEGARRYGAGSGASSLLSGHSRAHHEFEERLAHLLQPYLPECRGLYFCSGYTANMALLCSVAETAPAQCTIFSDALNHASIIDGARLAAARSGATVRVYPHGDLAALDRMLGDSEAGSLPVIVTDTVFSMDGDFAPVSGLLGLAERYRAWLILDDAHGFGAVGRTGLGCLEQFDLRSERIAYLGTLGKAAGLAGAFVAAHRDLIEWLIHRARPYVYSTATPPAFAYGLLCAIEMLIGPAGEARRRQLRENIDRFRARRQHLPYRLGDSTTSIQPIIIGENGPTMDLSARLWDRGLWVPAIRPPTVPEHQSRLRASITAAHRPEDIDELLHALQSPLASPDR